MKEKLHIRFFNEKNIDTLEEISKEHNFNINHINDKGMTALFRADYKKSEWLIKNGCDISVVDKKGKNALFYVKDKKKLMLLISNGIDINQIDNRGESFLHTADKKILKELVDQNINVKKIINKRDKQGYIPFLNFKRTFEEHLYLLKLGANHNSKTYERENILQIYCDDPDNLKFFLDNYKFKDIDEPYNDGTVIKKQEDNILFYLAEGVVAEEVDVQKQINNIMIIQNKYPNEFANMVQYLMNKYPNENVDSNSFKAVTLLTKLHVNKEKKILEEYLLPNNNIATNKMRRI
ncbi:TPA: hypothetical protein NV714_003501 [Escherichia coli]|nr:hypothetical protein [Escherichia coli]